MDRLNMLDPNMAQERLNKYFDTFREEEIKGVKYNIMPLKGEVPLIKRIGYYPSGDIFEIIFEYMTDAIKRKQGIVTFIEDGQGHLVGIQVSKIKKLGIAKVILETKTSLDRAIESVRVKLEQNPDPQEILKLALEKRKRDFFEEIIEKEMAQLVK